MLPMPVGRDSTEGLGTDLFVLEHRGKKHDLKEQVANNRDNTRSLPSSRGATGKLSKSEGLENDMVYMPTPP